MSQGGRKSTKTQTLDLSEGTAGTPALLMTGIFSLYCQIRSLCGHAYSLPPHMAHFHQGLLKGEAT